MKHYASIFRKDTGEIVQSLYFEFPDEDTEYAALNMEAAVLAFGPETHDYAPLQANIDTQYIQTLNGELAAVDKPQLVVNLDKTEIEADGIDLVTLTGLPDPCTILIDDEDPLTETTVTEVTGGGFTFSTEDPGDYIIEVRDRFPFLPFRTVITAS